MKHIPAVIRSHTKPARRAARVGTCCPSCWPLLLGLTRFLVFGHILHPCLFLSLKQMLPSPSPARTIGRTVNTGILTLCEPSQLVLTPSSARATSTPWRAWRPAVLSRFTHTMPEYLLTKVSPMPKLIKEHEQARQLGRLPATCQMRQPGTRLPGQLLAEPPPPRMGRIDHGQNPDAEGIIPACRSRLTPDPLPYHPLIPSHLPQSHGFYQSQVSVALCINSLCPLPPVSTGQRPSTRGRECLALIQASHTRPVKAPDPALPG